MKTICWIVQYTDPSQPNLWKTMATSQTEAEAMKVMRDWKNAATKHPFRVVKRTTFTSDEVVGALTC